MPEGKFFVLVSKLSGSAVGFDNGSTTKRLVTVPRNDEDEQQLWYVDQLSTTIRNKANQLCIYCTDDGNAALQSYEKGSASQQFVIDGNFVKLRKDGRVLDISGDSSENGVPLCVWEQHGETNQLFDTVFVRPRYFMLKGEQSGRVIDIVECNLAPGAKICIFDIQKTDNQLWYEDRTGLVRAKQNDFVFDDSAGDVCMQPYDANNPHRSWVINGAAVAQLSNPTQVLDVKGEECCNEAKLCSYENHNGPNQRWIVEYV